MPNFYIIIAEKYFFPDFVFGGVGTSPLAPIPVSYAYENVYRKSTSLYRMLQRKRFLVSFKH